MNRKLKFSLLFLLVFASVFWLSNLDENDSSEQSFNELVIEDKDFKKMINSKETRAELKSFLKNSKIEFEDFYMDEHYVVNFNSFSVEFDKYGIKIK